MGIAFIVCMIFATLVSLALAFPGTSSTYSFGSSTQGVAGGIGTSSTYSLRSTQTANQASNGNATSSSYSMNIGWFNLTYDAGVVTLTMDSVECSNDTANYYTCTQMAYNANVTHIRVNCSATNSNVTTVSFRLYNTPDATYYINQTNYTYKSGDLYILNSSYKLQDSGEWNLTVTCYNNASNTTSNSTNWTLPWGWVNVSLVSPSSDANVTKDQFFTFQSTVTCVDGECGTANVTLDPYEVENNLTDGALQDTGYGLGGAPDDGTGAVGAEQIVNAINILLEYKGGSQWDEDNDGIETTAGAVDLTVENTEIDPAADRSRLCTKWTVTSLDSGMDMTMCNGPPECCVFAGVAPEKVSWDEPLYLFYGKYGATYNNMITSQMIYSLDMTDPASETYYSEPETLPVTYVESNITPEVAHVFDEGESIDIDGKKIGEKVEDEQDYETHFASIEQNDTALRLVFYHDAETSMRIRVVGEVESTLSKRRAEPFENVTLTVQKVEGVIPRFELHLGEESEVFQFGKVVPDVTIAGGQYTIIDREDDKLNVDIVKNGGRIEIVGVKDEPEINADIVPTVNPVIQTDVAYIENLTDIESATVSLPADDVVTAIFYCAGFDALTSTCDAWQKTDIPFVQEDGMIMFTVTHFSAYAGGTTNDTAYLVIWDETDPGMPNASQSKALNDTVLFFADYKISANGTKITDGTCQIKFGSGNYTDMTYNSTYTYYVYNRTFDTNGVYSFNIKCNHSTYSELNATDTISVPTSTKNGAVSTTTGATPFYTNSSNPQTCNVSHGGDSCLNTWYVNATGVLDTSHVFFVMANMTSNTAYISDNQSSNITLTITANDSTAPTIADTNVSPLIANTGATITIYATATDNVQVATCWANITLPNSSVVQKTDVCTSAKTYTTEVAGVHNVTFYANDTSGNAATPASVTFTVDTDAPNLNSTSASVTASSSTISYAANESVNASVSYGTISTSLTSTATETSYATSGTITLSSLSASTTYYYNITICDQAANCLTNGTYNFTTSASTGGGGSGGGGGGVTAECLSDWVCTSWSSCSESGEKTRSCTDVNGCGNDDGPSETASCIYVLPPKPKQAKAEAKAEEALALPSEGAAAGQVEAPPAIQEQKSTAAPAPITGAAVKQEQKARWRVTLETGWWFLLFLVLLVIAITLAIERRRRKKPT
ncbi:MAG: hypothetical protein KKD17_02815 [Nanoarchaeota archaeon]|nr:hypothetical protein [Nanoarchaeota archaeon]